LKSGSKVKNSVVDPHSKEYQCFGLIRKKKNCGSESEKICGSESEKNEFGYTTLINTQ
jgi:hypothetical protein